MSNKPIKVLTEEGLRVLWNQISLDDYPNNDLLIAVLDGIDATKADKTEVADAKEEVLERLEAVAAAGVDWNQNNSEAIDYVKNRTHWVEESMTELIPDTEIPEVDGGGKLSYEAFIKLNVGETYIVTCDGTEYNCIAKDLSSVAPDLVGFGDLSIFGMTSDAPFGVVLSDGKVLQIFTPSPCTMSIKHSVETVHQLDEKFIPDTIPRVDLVDSMIMESQADWNQNNESAPDFIKNRTHYETVVYTEYRPEMVVVTDELVEETGAYMSNQSTDLFVGTGVYTVILDGVTYENIEFTHGHTGNRFLWEKDLTVEGDTTHNPNLPFAFSYNGMGYSFFYSTTAGEHTLTVLQKNGTEVKQLDEKFIPDTIARKSDLQNIDLSSLETKSDAASKLQEAKDYSDANLEVAQAYADAAKTQAITEGANSAVNTINAKLATDYYAKEQIDDMVFITTNDIDTICGASIQMASEVTF